MLLLGQDIVKRGIVTGCLNDDVQIQSSGVDLTLKLVYQFVNKGRISCSNKSREIPEYVEVDCDKNGYFDLTQGAYIFEYNEFVDTPKDAALSILPRSSMIRSGVSLASGLFDAGYAGPISSLFSVNNSYGILIERNARVAQLSCQLMEKEHPTGYNGKYQNKSDIRGEG